MSFLSFLKQSRLLLNRAQVGSTAKLLCIVIGNESCDLDSAVCALTLAFLEQQNNPVTTSEYLPVLNVPRRDYELKTEVCYLFRRHGIQPEQHLTFRDELTDELLAQSRFILVDHHVSPHAARVDMVYDHRPFDEANANLTENCVKHIETVGSCATLVAEQYLCREQTESKLPLQLLYCAMLLDTINFSADAGRAQAKDFCVVDALEQQLSGGVPSEAERSAIFGELVDARADVSRLTSEQLLRKDMKLLAAASMPGLRIALPGIPMLVQHFINRPDAIAAIQQFAHEQECLLVLLLGMWVRQNDGSVQRDLGLIDVRQTDQSVEFLSRIRVALEWAREPNFGLELLEDVEFMGGVFYQQTNVKATRKHILPVVRQTMDT